MSSDETTRPSLDRAIGALRLMLISAQDDDAARNQVLPALCRCTVLVPTWPNAPHTMRVLTSPTGEVAMPLFTGRDALEHAAQKFNWHGGATSFRTMGAREALFGAHEATVKLVVLDAGAEHALELPRHEVLTFLQRTSAVASDETQPIEPAPKPTLSRSPMEQRIERAMAEAAAAESAKKHAPEKPAPVAPPAAAAPSAAAAPPAVATPRKKRGLAEIDDPFANAAIPRPPSKPAPAGGTARRVPSGALTPLARHMPSRPFQSEVPPRPDSRPSAPARARSSPRPPVQGRAETLPMEQLANVEPASTKARAEQPQAPAAAPTLKEQQVAPRVAHGAPIHEAPLVRSADDYEFGGGASDAPDPTAAKSFAPPAAPARPLVANKTEPEHTRASDFSHLAHTGQAPKPATLSEAALSAERVSTELPSRPRAEPAPAAAPLPAAPAAVHTPAVAAEAAHVHAPARQAAREPAPKPARETSLTAEAIVAPFATVDDVVLSALADELRKYPEVEWACEVADGGVLPIIALRIDPSYMARAEEIQAHASQAAADRKSELRVILLKDLGATKQARAVGRMFFPWKKKR